MTPHGSRLMAHASLSSCWKSTRVWYVMILYPRIPSIMLWKINFSDNKWNGYVEIWIYDFNEMVISHERI